jgi:hypothetical protein
MFDMEFAMHKDAIYLDTLAATQIIGDSEVAYCWELVRFGIQTYKLGLGNLGDMIEHLRAGNGKAMNEFGIEILPDEPERALVAVLDDERTCPATKLIAELERLLERAGKGGNSSSSVPPGGTVPPAGQSSALPSSGTQAASAPDLLGVIAGLLGTTPARLAGDPEAYRAQVERVRAATAALASVVGDPTSDEAARATAAARLRQVLAESAHAGEATARVRMAEVAGTMAALGIDSERFAAALRMVADWLESRTPAAGAAVDRMIAALDEAAGPLLGGADRASRDAERETRARNAARAAIAARLGPRPGSA